MSNDTTPHADETTAEDLKTGLLRFVLKKTIGDAVKDEIADDRGEILDRLVEFYGQTGAARLAVTHPETGEVLANLTLTIPKESKVATDPDALLAWAKENRPWWVQTETIPGRPAWVETIQHPATEDRVVEHVDESAWQDEAHVVTDDGQVVTPDGETIPGVKVARPSPDKFSVTYPKRGGESQRKIIGAWRAGEFPGLAAGNALPVIGEIEAAE